MRTSFSINLKLFKVFPPRENIVLFIYKEGKFSISIGLKDDSLHLISSFTTDGRPMLLDRPTINEAFEGS
jgi:hypothetical protein